MLRHFISYGCSHDDDKLQSSETNNYGIHGMARENLSNEQKQKKGVLSIGWTVTKRKR